MLQSGANPMSAPHSATAIGSSGSTNSPGWSVSPQLRGSAAMIDRRNSTSLAMGAGATDPRCVGSDTRGAGMPGSLSVSSVSSPAAASSAVAAVAVAALATPTSFSHSLSHARTHAASVQHFPTPPMYSWY